MSNLVGNFRHFDSCSHYLRGFCFPFAISERLVHTGHLLIRSTLADKRKRSPGSNLPEVLTVPRTQHWFTYLGYENGPMEMMHKAFGELTWTGAPPRPEIVLALRRPKQTGAGSGRE